MKRILLLLVSILILPSILFPTPTFAQNDPVPIQEFEKAKVIKVVEEGEKQTFDIKRPYQILEVKLLDKNQTIKIENGTNMKITDTMKVKEGDIVVLYRTTFAGRTDEYQIIDKYRLDNLLYIIAFFFVLVIAISRLKGIGSILGLILTFFVIIKYIIPQILDGKDPVTTTILGSSFIIFTTIYLAHGFSKKTSIAIASTIISLVITGVMATLFIKLGKLSGLADEAAYGLSMGPSTSGFNYKGLLLSGIIIGALGVLDDITTTQSAAVFELAKAKIGMSFPELVKRGFSIGKEHIASLVNTLVLAYTGAALPILLIIVLNPSKSPLWFILNNESIAEELVRTLSGSIGLVLSVPITTVMAAYFATKPKK